MLTPRWWGINLFAVLAIPVCLFMGSWQLSRFEVRVDSHRQQERAEAEAAHAKAEPLSKVLPVTTETVGRMTEATGRYDTRHQLLVPEREVRDGDAQKRGFYVLSLLRTDEGKALPVVRGWLPGSADPGRVPEAPRGEVTVRGALQASESPRSPGAHAGGLPEGQIGVISAASLVNVVPYGVHDAWITVQKTSGTDAALKPVPPAAPANTGLDMKAFQNLGYTAEWFVFAGFVVFMWFRLFRREVELVKDAELGLVPEEPYGGDALGAAADAGATAAAEPEDAATGQPRPADDGGQSRSPASTA
nr:SURF1 family protein [Streptomyces sp. HNM0574]